MKVNESLPVEPANMERPCLDLTHLNRQTMGDVDLQRELFQLFDGQARQFLPCIQSVSPSEGAEAARIAHTLKGSARAIGAFELADAAQAFEEALHSGPPEAEDARRKLLHAIERALARIAEFL